MTYKQAQSLGAQVRKGEKGTNIIYYTNWEKENAEGEKENIPMIKSFTVFNIEQIEGLNIPEVAAIEEGSIFESLDHVEIFKEYWRENNRARASAFYRPSTDSITMPSRGRFSNHCDFYATALHELTHWTGAKHRLDRIKGSRFGSDDYAFEELIAEIGASF